MKNIAALTLVFAILINLFGIYNAQYPRNDTQEQVSIVFFTIFKLQNVLVGAFILNDHSYNTYSTSFMTLFNVIAKKKLKPVAM